MLLLCQIVTPAMVRPPWASRSSWPLSVSLTDSMIWRKGLKNSVPGRGFSPFWVGRSRESPPSLRVFSKLHPTAARCLYRGGQ